MIELTKAQKKAARILIDRGLQRECERFLLDVKRLVDTPLQEDSPHKRYLELYKKIDRFDHQIGETYDGLGGSRYFITVAGLYYRDVLTEEEIGLMGDELKAKIMAIRDL